MKKVLLVSSTAAMIKQFNMDNIQILKSMNYEIHVATNFGDINTIPAADIAEFKNKLSSDGIKVHQIDFKRGIGTISSNIKSYKQLKEITDQNDFSFIHVQSPIASIIARAVARNKIRVIYTAHGFQFFKGGPKKDWLTIYPVEKFMSKWTDILVTINTEDYQLAQKKFKAKKVMYLPGIGIDIDKIRKVQPIKDFRESLNINEDGKILVSAGELNDNKNQISVIEAVHQINNPNLYYLICGIGENKELLEQKIKEYGLQHNILLLGFRSDLISVIRSSDVFIFPSKREGLSVALMEAISTGIPEIAANIRGNNDLIINGKTGWLYQSDNIEEMKDLINKVISMNEEEYKRVQSAQLEHINKFDLKNVHKEMTTIYQMFN